MDINMVVDIPTLKKQDSFKDFRKQYEADSRKCLSPTRDSTSAGSEL